MLIDTLDTFPLVRLQHTESFEYLMGQRPVKVLNFQARPSPSTAALRAAVELLEAGDKLRMLTLEHLDIAVDDELNWVAIGAVSRL